MKITAIKTPKGVSYSDAPQGSPEWIESRFGRIGASELYRWMAVGKRDGKPLKSRTDLEREKAFEKAFEVPFSRFVTGAMQQGIDNEDFVRDQYGSSQGVVVEKAGAFYDEYSVASPDGLIGEDGGLEIKWLQDSSWADVVTSGKVPDEHHYQVQGNLRLSGRKWWDYVAANGSTGRFIVIRVERDDDLIGRITEEVKAVADVEPLKTDGIFEFSTVAPVPITIEGENPWV